MKVSKRESFMILACITVILGVSTYLFAEKKIKGWKVMGVAKADLLAELELDQRLVDQRGDWEQQLEELTSRLKSYPASQEVTPQFMSEIDELGRSHGLGIGRQLPEKERDLGNLYEVSFKSSFEGSLESLVRFLFALQNKGPVFTVKSLEVKPTGNGDELEGFVTVDCAYSRKASARDRSSQ